MKLYKIVYLYNLLLTDKDKKTTISIWNITVSWSNNFPEKRDYCFFLFKYIKAFTSFKGIIFDKK